MIVIADVLDRHEVEALREAADAIAFEDGRATAGRYASGVKSNLQARPSEDVDAILGMVRDRLMASDLFRSVARPRHFARLLLSRYGPGMEYGLHVDDPVMHGSRTDLSFTLPLSDATAYDGGGGIAPAGIDQPRLGEADLL